MFKQLALFAILCSSVFAQAKVEVEPFVAITAKSARTEPLSDRVAVFLTDRDKIERPGAWLKITSASKWATPYLPSVEITESSVPGNWMMFAPPGKYLVTVIEFDPERGPKFTGVEVVIPGATIPGPIDPPPVDPPTGDFGTLAILSNDLADKLADDAVRKVLAGAYGSAIEAIEAKKLAYDQALQAVSLARFAALSTVPMTKDWNGGFLKPISLALSKIVPAGDVAAYTNGIKAIKQGLDK